MTKRLIVFISFLSILFVWQGMAIDLTATDTETRVPALMDFHQVIYPIWHQAYPEKDYAALRGFVKEINERFTRIEQAELPGILRHRRTAWDQGLANLKKSVEDYNRAAAGNDNQKLLDAAEELHMRYEMMVRVILPVLKEIEEYHKVLYVVYHKYLPEKNFDNIKNTAPEMVSLAEAITRAKLMNRLEAKQKEFNRLAGRLLQETQILATTCESGDNSAIMKDVETAHTAYMNLVELFE